MAAPSNTQTLRQPRSNVAPQPASPRSSLIRLGLWTGLFAAFIVFLWGAQAPIMAGLLAGVICGFVGSGRAAYETPTDGAKAAITAAAVAGGILLLAHVVRFYGLEAPGYVQNNQVHSGGSVLSGGVTGLVIAMLVAGLLGGAHYLHGSLGRLTTIGIVGLLVLLFPFIDAATGIRWSSNLIPILVFTLLALGLNIVVGYAGLLDLGYAAFFAIGAYTTGLLSSNHLGGQIGYGYQMNFWIVIWVAAVVAAIFGVILGAPTLPLRGDYLAIVTLGFGEIVPIVFRNLTSLTISVPFTDIVLIGPKGIWADLSKPLNLTNGEFGINPIQQPKLQLIDMPKLLNGELGTRQTVGAIIGLIVFAAFVALGITFLVRTLQTQWINKVRPFPQIGTGIATAVALGMISFIFFGQYYTWLMMIYMTVVAAILTAVLVMRKRDYRWGLGGFTGTLLLLIGFFIFVTSYTSARNITLSFSDTKQTWLWYFLVIGLMLLTIFFINRLRRSRLGRAWMAMREDELAAGAMGIDLVKTKLLAFAMGATFSGFAGAYFAAYIQAIFPSLFDFSVSVLVLCMVILGGLGNMTGVVVGGLIIMSADRLFLPQMSGFLQDLARNTNKPIFTTFDINTYRTGLFGLVLVVMMQVRPEGLIPNSRRKLELRGDETTIQHEHAALVDAERDPQLAKE